MSRSMSGWSLVWGASLAMLLAPAAAVAETPTAPTAKAPVAAATKAKRKVQVKDVALATGGTMVGRVVDAQGRPARVDRVTIYKPSGEFKQVMTDREGRFHVRGLKGGVYQVAAGQSSQVYRAWANKTAPPAATKSILLVSDPTVVAAQWEPGTLGHFFGGMRAGLSNPVVVAGIIAAAVAIPVAIHNADDDDSPSGS